MKKHITISDFVTLLNLLCGFLAIVFIDFRYILLAIVFDFLDGKVARKTNTATDFGKELDSLSDAISFGLAPTILVLNGSSDLFYIITSFIFLSCGVLRLARFNILNEKETYTGLPIPIAALLIIIIDLILKNIVLNEISFIILGYLMISNFKIRKF
jgi:CDP-diacylglycerol--serine O-phosphatidyltransferase